MALKVKICGVNSAPAMAAACEGGADFVGLMFYPPSPRYLNPAAAAALAAMVPAGTLRVGVFVDESDEAIAEILDTVPLDALQFHGAETPARVRQSRERFGLPIVKAVRLAEAADLALAREAETAADMILFDAKPPASMAGALPGGNALAFDWELLAGTRWARPWFLSGGLDAGNLGEAVATSGAAMVDVSSGVETAPGVKDSALIRAFLAAARSL